MQRFIMENFRQILEKSPEEKALDFGSLEKEQADFLKRKIEESKGLVRVFIHADWFTDEYEKRIKGPVIRILKSEKSPPLFFFEDLRYFEDIKKLFKALNDDTSFLANPVYLVKTLECLPYPVIDGEPLPPSDKESSSISKENIDYGYKSLVKFILILNALGVKKVLVGGSELIIDDKGDINKCVGNFIKFFDLIKEIREEHPDSIPDIDIKLSEITVPKNRSDMRGVRDDLL